ncbi:hypothetical protein HOF17_00855 [Candidatus Peribacteria bacterium]|nr:hypothetical protein [Candidatus Peribacteria bacterium]
MKKLIAISTLLVLPMTTLAGGPANMDPSLYRSNPVSTTSEGINIENTGIWQINTELPANHPCSKSGGEWRGWCMDTSELGSGVVPMKRVSNKARGIRNTVDACSDIENRSQRSACYRERTLKIWGRSSARMFKAIRRNLR